MSVKGQLHPSVEALHGNGYQKKSLTVSYKYKSHMLRGKTFFWLRVCDRLGRSSHTAGATRPVSRIFRSLELSSTKAYRRQMSCGTCASCFASKLYQVDENGMCAGEGSG